MQNTSEIWEERPRSALFNHGGRRRHPVVAFSVPPILRRGMVHDNQPRSSNTKHMQQVSQHSYALWVHRVCYYHVTATLDGQAFENLPQILFTSRALNKVVFEAIDPFIMAPKSMSNTHKVFHGIHMQWKCIWLADTMWPMFSLANLYKSSIELWLLPFKEKTIV